MIPVEVILKLVVGVEGPLDVLDRASEAEYLVFHPRQQSEITTG